MRFVTCLMALLLAAPAAAQPAWLSQVMAGPPQLSAVAAVVTNRDHEIAAFAAGDAVTGQRPMSLDAPVRVASVSKLVLTLGIMRLVEQGKLSLDRDVSDYLGWKLRNPTYPDTPVTLRLLLSHRSSLTDAGGYFWPLGAALKDEIGPKSWRTDAGPDGGFNYANINYGVAAQVMEKVTGQRFDRLMTRLVFKPLTIDACFNWSGCSPAAIARAAVIYRKGPADSDAWRPDGPWVAQLDDLKGRAPPCLVRLPAPDAPCDLARYKPGTNGTLFSPQGGLRISVRDLGRIGRLLLNRGTLDGVRFLKPSSVDAMMTPRWRAGDGITGNDYGGSMRCWGISMQCLDADELTGDASRVWWGHFGDAYGLWSGLWVDPLAERAYAYVVTGTSDDPDKFRKAAGGLNPFEVTILKGLVAAP